MSDMPFTEDEGRHMLGWNKPMRDFRDCFTPDGLAKLVDRFVCLYTREPAEEWHHSTEEMMAVLQMAQDAVRYKGQLDEAYGSLIQANDTMAKQRELIAELRDVLKESNELCRELTAHANRVTGMMEGMAAK